ncbi:MAG: hypothetical protein ACRD5K_14450 [Candidatus Acidiferrales bacterium]
MSTAMDERQELMERVGRLERQNRFWKIGGIAAIGALAVSLTATLWAQERVLPRGAERPLRVQTVESEHFVLKDSAGATRGEFTVTPTGPVLELLGPDGKVIWSTKGGWRPAGD